MICCYCKKENGETRPYGPGGAACCFDCAMLDANMTTTTQQAVSQLKAAEEQSASGVVFIGEETGPRPLKGTR